MEISDDTKELIAQVSAFVLVACAIILLVSISGIVNYAMLMIGEQYGEVVAWSLLTVIVVLIATLAGVVFIKFESEF